MDKTNAEAITQYELDTWGRCANEYLDTFAGLTSQALPLLIESLGDCQGQKTLDLGCGPGNAAAMLSQQGAEVSGADFSPQMVKVAQARYPHISFYGANGEALPFGDSEFDVVVCNYVVHHFAQPDLVFSEIFRVLKPGGRLVFAVWGAPEDQSSIGAFFAAVMAHHDLAELPHGPLFGVTERSVYEPLLTEAGFSDCHLAMHAVNWEMASLEPLLKGFWSWGNISMLPTHIQSKIKESTSENAQAFDKDGMFVFPHTALVASAVKA